MGALTKPLLGLAALGLLVGVFVHLMVADATGVVDAASQLPAQFLGAFDAEWAWLLRGAVGASALAVMLLVLQAILSLRAPPKAPEFAQLDEGHSLKESLDEVARRVHTCTQASSPNVVAAFNELVRGASAVTASDIHITPMPDGLRLTYRVHGSLYEVTRLDPSLAPPLATRVKVLAHLDTYVRGTPQDGRLVVGVDGGTIEARVSTLPTENGERIVLRLVRGSRTVPDVESLGFSDEVLNRLTQVLARPQGMLLVTGPVGSGKTTTLYASLKHVASSRQSTTTLVTLEDPIELELPFATQTQMHPKAGMTFASVLRSVLRQDPNVLMVGEIRDRETADIATQAGLTGHLILTTVHGESAAGAFARLLDMDIEPFALASAAVGALSQRLVRTLCTACRREATPEQFQVESFQKAGVVVPPGTYFEPVGCMFCEGTGFTGRVPIAELLLVEEKVRQAISERKTTAELHAIAQAEGMTALLRQGVERARRGETSLEEVLRVAR